MTCALVSASEEQLEARCCSHREASVRRLLLQLLGPGAMLKPCLPSPLGAQLPPAAAAPTLCRQLLTLTFGMPMKPMHLRPVSRMSCARTRRSASGSAAGTLWRWKSASGAEALRVSSVAVCGRHGVSLGLWQQQ